MADKTTVEIDTETWRRLNHQKESPTDTFDTVIRRLLDHYESCEE
jgi:predicted CopG family antitoxin